MTTRNEDFSKKKLVIITEPDKPKRKKRSDAGKPRGAYKGRTTKSISKSISVTETMDQYIVTHFGTVRAAVVYAIKHHRLTTKTNKL